MSLSTDDINAILEKRNFTKLEEWNPTGAPYISSNEIEYVCDPFELPDSGWLMAWFWGNISYQQTGNYIEGGFGDPGHPHDPLESIGTSGHFFYWSGQAINNDPYLCIELNEYGECVGDYGLLTGNPPNEQGRTRIGPLLSPDYEDTWLFPRPPDKETGSVAFPYGGSGAWNPDDTNETAWWNFSYYLNEPAAIGHAVWQPDHYDMKLYKLKAPPGIIVTLAPFIALAGCLGSIFARRPPHL